MKIAIIGKFTNEEMGWHISSTLKEMGHQTYEIEFGPKLNQNKNNLQSLIKKINIHKFNLGVNLNIKTRSKVIRNIIKELNEINGLDLILCTHDWLSYHEINILKQTGSKIVLWFPDGIINFGRAYFMTAGYDYLFFKDPYIVKNLIEYYQMDNVFYLPEAFNPQVHHPMTHNDFDKNEFGCDISMVGNLHSFRVPILEKLSNERKYDIKIYGGKNPFYVPISNQLLSHYTNRFAGNETKSKSIQYSKIALNTLHMGEVESANVRVFEIAGIGAFQLTAYREGLKDLFEIGKEIETYSSYTELLEKIDYYLENTKERLLIAERGRERALKDHTYKSRLAKLLDTVFVNERVS